MTTDGDVNKSILEDESVKLGKKIYEAKLFHTDIYGISKLMFKNIQELQVNR